MKIMVFDVGGTEIKYSVMDEQMHRTNSGAVPTPQDTQAQFLDAVYRLYAPHKDEVSGIAMALPGFVDNRTGYVSNGGALLYNTATPVGQLLAEKLARYAEKGQVGRPLKLMIVGIPNVGKSTFINQVAGRKGAKAENRPGVTRGKQWITVDQGLLLLDTPGILWPKFEDQTVGQHLAFIGSIKDELIQSVELALDLIEFLTASYPGILGKTYSVDESEDSVAILNAIAVNRGCLKKGNELDHDKAAFLLLDDFRNARLGKISVENPQDGENNGN